MFDVVATVSENRHFGGYGHLTLKFDRQFESGSGQFGMLKPKGAFDPLLRRAMAIYRHETDGKTSSVEFIYQVFGRGTENLRCLNPGDAVECLLPLGKPFDISAVTVGGREALLVAGGVGSAALFLLAQQLKREGVPTRLFLGGRSTVDLIGLEDFVALGIPVHIATNDGTRGFAGYVSGPLEKFLNDNAEDVQVGKFVVFTCGPTPMMKAVAQICEKANVLAYASLEERMACGFGVCVGCVAGVRCDDGETDYQRVCIEGPVFRCDQLVWSE